MKPVRPSFPLPDVPPLPPVEPMPKMTPIPDQPLQPFSYVAKYGGAKPNPMVESFPSKVVPVKGAKSLKDQKTTKEIEILELKILKEKGKLWDSGDVREAWVRVLTGFRLDLMGTASQCAAATVGRSVAEIESMFKAGIEQVFSRMIQNPLGGAAKESEPKKETAKARKARALAELEAEKSALEATKP